VAALDKAKRALVSLMLSLAIAYGCLTTDGALHSVRKYDIAITIVPYAYACCFESCGPRSEI
jgi:hypothetical protein